MDKEKLMEMVAAAVKSQMEALEARLAKLEAVEVEVKPEEEPPAEVAAMAARVVALEKRAADAEYAVWRAQTPAAAKLPDASARALYAAEPKAREGLLKAMGAVPPAMPAMGSGAAASEVEPLSSDPREAYRQISARFPDPKMRDAEWARVRDTYNR